MNSRHGRRRGFAFVLGTAAVAASLALSGCYDSATDPNSDVATTVASELTLDEVMAKVQITNEQAAALSPVLDSWRQQQRAGNGNQLGALRMLADASDVLDNGQMVGLLALLEEKQVAVRNGRKRGEGPRGPGQGQGPGRVGDHPRHPGPNGGPGGQRGPGGQGWQHGPRDGHGGRGAGLLEELNLDATQQAAVQAAREEMRAAAKALHEQFRAGSITKDELRAAMQPLRDEMRTKIEGILTAEQLAQLNALRDARILTHLEKALERVNANLTEKLPLVARVLDLDEQQLAAATALHEDRATALSAIIESLRGGQTTGEEAKQAAQALRTQSLEDFRALLNAEQQEIFDALKTLQHRRHGRGPRP